MANQSMIFGSIEGILKKDFERLKNDLNKYFDEVGWKENALIIKSSRNHGGLNQVFKKIADCVQEGKAPYRGHCS